MYRNGTALTGFSFFLLPSLMIILVSLMEPSVKTAVLGPWRVCGGRRQERCFRDEREPV